MDAQRLQFAQQKQSEDVIEIGIGEGDAGNRRMAQTPPRMQLRRSFDLGQQIWRSAQQEPQEAVFGDRDLGLRARLAVERAGSHGATICAGAIPLRKPASGRGTQNLYSHLPVSLQPGIEAGGNFDENPGGRFEAAAAASRSRACEPDNRNCNFSTNPAR